MLRFSEINLRPDNRTLRQFAFAWLVFFGGLGAWRLYSRGPSAANYTMAIAGLVIGLAGLGAPRLIRIVYAAATVLAFPIGWVVSRFLIGVVYYALITPVGLLMRMNGRDRLRLRRPSADVPSLWVPREQSKEPSRYLRQY